MSLAEDFASAHIKIDSSDPKIEPALQVLNILNQADLICHLWQQYVRTALLPLASSVTTRREMAHHNNQAMSRIENSANSLLQKFIDCTHLSISLEIACSLLPVLLSWLSFQLSKQKKNDFKPRNEELSFARMNTEPCESCCEMLEKIRDTARLNLSGKNLEAFLFEIGAGFHG